MEMTNFLQMYTNRKEKKSRSCETAFTTKSVWCEKKLRLEVTDMNDQESVLEIHWNKAENWNLSLDLFNFWFRPRPGSTNIHTNILYYYNYLYNLS